MSKTPDFDSLLSARRNFATQFGEFGRDRTEK